MPCMILLATRLSRSTQYSDWPSMSMKPGATTSPVASIAAGPGRRRLRRCCGNPVADYADVGREPGCARAVDDAPTGDEQVARRHRLYGPQRDRQGGEQEGNEGNRRDMAADGTGGAVGTQGDAAHLCEVRLRHNGAMRERVFGRTGWAVGDVGYGMWGMGGWTGSDDDESRRSLERAVRCGCTFFDTAWAYGMGHSERLLGDLVRTASERAVSTRRRRFRRRTRSGRLGPSIRSTRCFPRTTSGSSPRRASRTSVSRRSI